MAASTGMNEPERIELARLKEHQKRLEAELQSLSQQLKAFEAQLRTARSEELPTQGAQTGTLSTVPQTISTHAFRPVPATPDAVPPIITNLRVSQVPVEQRRPAAKPGPAVVPGAISATSASTPAPAVMPSTASQPQPHIAHKVSTPPKPPAGIVPPVPQTSQASQP